MHDDLTFEVRFVVSHSGKILQANKNGQDLITENGDMFFDHFTPQHRQVAIHYMKALSSGADIQETKLYQNTGDTIKAFKYRGKTMDGNILLVGLKIDDETVNSQVSPGLQLQLGESIFDALDVGIVTLDHHNNIVYRNKVSKNRGRYRQGNTEMGTHPIVPIIREMANDIQASGNDAQCYHLYDKSLFHVHGLYNKDKKLTTFIIDDRAASEEFDSLLKYKQQMESVSHLSAGFAHELRNPLSVIRGFIQLSALTNNVKKYYQTILSEIDRMNSIIEDFLSLSRKVPQKEVYEPYEFFQSVIPLIRSECLLRNIRLEYDFKRTNAELLLNRSMVKQVILNLLRNAIEAFEDDQKEKCFSLSGRGTDAGYEIVVKDNGPGMEKNVLDQLGKPFFTTKEKGTGIGLPLCKKIIEDHHGQFIINSVLKQGTTITIVFPLKS